MKKLSVFVIIVVSAVLFSAFISALGIDKPIPILPSKQRSGGNSQKGYEYLVTGDYVKSGLPYNFFQLALGASSKNFLERTDLNKKLPYNFTAVKAANGEIVAAPNCLQCHAQVFDDKLVIGLGNTDIDFTKGKLDPGKLQKMESLLKKLFPKKYEASAPFITATKAIGPYLTSEVRGVNLAGRLTYALVAHRDPQTFKWNEEASLQIPAEVIPTDTPPWWLLKKKNAMFYNGFGRGDFGRFLMASNLLTVNDTSESRQVDEHMPDMLAYIYSLQSPKYPHPIDKALAAEGQVLFENKCSKCHGYYGEGETYPNLLVPESIIKTDSALYKSNYSAPQFIDWFNKSWFAQGDHPAKLEPFAGYIAPPLDGIWVTAPYLHNGSVPTLEALLNSDSRPRYWSRDFNHQQYDYENVGWKYTAHDKPDGSASYNTDLPGYGNYGHYFGDGLSASERKTLIEYLKTL